MSQPIKRGDGYEVIAGALEDATQAALAYANAAAALSTRGFGAVTAIARPAGARTLLGTTP